MRSVGTKLALIMVAVLLPLFIGVTFYNQYQSSEKIKQLHLERARILALTGAASIGKQFEDAVKTGQLTQDQIFDTSYRKIPGSEPPRYKTAYDDWTDNNLRQIADVFLKDETVVFTVAVDINGYLPTHNTKYSQGDYSQAGNRTKRKFDDPVGSKAAKNTEPVLTQEYKRDTGEIMWDVSSPIFINGRHWGAFRVGYSMDKTYKAIAAERSKVLILSIVYAVILILLAFFISRLLTGPLKKIADSATRLSRGDLTGASVEIRGNDEIAKMVAAFNGMKETIRRLLGEIKDKSIRLSAFAQQLTASAEQSSSSATETATTINQVASNAGQVTVNIQAVTRQSDNTCIMAEQGKNMLALMEEKMNNIAATSLQASRGTHGLIRKIGDISQMTTLITQIADQTNLLALNAAIEAARAGEAGKGFAVVAEEVRKLAEQSSSAAKEIMSLTQTIESESSGVVQAVNAGESEITEGTAMVSKAGKTFEEIISAVEKLNGSVQNALNAVYEVNVSVQDIAATAQEQSATGQELAASVEELGRIAEDLNRFTEEFKTE